MDFSPFWCQFFLELIRLLGTLEILYEEDSLDTIVLVTWGVPAPLENEIPEIVTNPELFDRAVRFMVPFNYADVPLVVVPQRVASESCKQGDVFCEEKDRPFSFPLIGSNNSDSAAILLQLAHAYEQKRGPLVYPYDNV